MDGMPHDANAPQLRTLLLTDLCDSTGLVERLGDGVAASLFRDHDRLVLELQQRWRGRLIDRSDGLLLLFERPLDGLGFALDYRLGLDALGRAHRLGPILARAGLHVGEVLIWRNSPEAVSAGAKPVEVEGLAKPFAARLMHLARPGQILLSSVAEPLLRRSVSELGARGDALQWRTHGRWLFKGVPKSQEVHEVGEPGLAPLRVPRGDAKARRDVPVWRHPFALAMEAAAVVGLVVGGWFMTRPEPAIAFAERDWVVVGDLRNLTGQTVLDDSLEQAFRISLEQSRYVNVLSDLKVRNTLARMERDPDATTVDREVGAEVAQRDGARLLILPTVAEVGGRVRFSAEIVDPVTQRTLAVEARDGKGLESALPSIDAVTVALRDSMGETLAAIQKDSAPLPQVTTSNLDALRAYARGQQAFGSSRYAQAEGLYARAVEFDPDFALAYIGLMRAARAQTDVTRGMDGLAKAMARRDRLPARDRLYLDAWNAEVNSPENALEKWKQLAELYPDYFPAHANIGYTLLGRNRYAEALEYAQRAAVPQSEFAALSSVLVGQLRLALGDEAGASQAFTAAHDGGVANAMIGQAISLASRRDFAGAGKAWPEETSLEFAYFDRASLLVDQGRWTEAVAELRRQLERTAPDSLRRDVGLVSLATIQWSSGDTAAAARQLRSVADRLLVRATGKSTPRSDANDAAYAALTAALLAQRMGDAQFAPAVLRQLGGLEQVGLDAPLGKLYTTVRANQSRLAGDSRQAVAMLEPLLDGSEPVQTHSVLLAAYRALGEDEKALAQAQWLSAHRGRAYVELGCGRCQQALNVYDSVASHIERAELQASAANAADARASVMALTSMWPADRMPDHLRRRTEAVLAAFN